jgi:hypothetical protein
MRKIVRATFGCLLSLIVADFALGQRALPPNHLTLGYDDEGKIDASPQSCLDLVKGITQWDEADTLRGALEVCVARKKHIDAYAALQASYKTFIQEVMKDNRYNSAEATRTVPTLVRACISHKLSITTGGHNTRIDIINNEIAATCLMLAVDLLRDETRELAAH